MEIEENPWKGLKHCNFHLPHSTFLFPVEIEENPWKGLKQEINLRNNVTYSFVSGNRREPLEGIETWKKFQQPQNLRRTLHVEIEENPWKGLKPQAASVG